MDYGYTVAETQSSSSKHCEPKCIYIFNWFNQWIRSIDVMVWCRLSATSIFLDYRILILQPVLATLAIHCNAEFEFARTTFIRAVNGGGGDIIGWRRGGWNITLSRLATVCWRARAPRLKPLTETAQMFQAWAPFRFSPEHLSKPSTVARKGRKGMKCHREHILVQQIERNGFVSYFVRFMRMRVSRSARFTAHFHKFLIVHAPSVIVFFLGNLKVAICATYFNMVASVSLNLFTYFFGSKTTISSASIFRTIARHRPMQFKIR